MRRKRQTLGLATGTRRSAWLGALGIVLHATLAHGSVFEDFAGVRTLGMGGAHRGVGQSNETLLLNPGGMATFKRYGIDLQYGYGTDDRLSRFNMSAVDSKSGPVAGGVAYTLIRGNESGVDASISRISAGTAYALGQALAIGITAQNLRGSFKENGAKQELSLYNGTVGLALNLGELIGLGVAYQNVLKTNDVRFMPPTLGFGAAVRTPSIVLAADMVTDLRDGQPHQTSYNVGGEFFAAQTLALRLGWRRKPALDASGILVNRAYLSGGVGWLSPSGGFNFSAERALFDSRPWSLIASMQFFM